jgi:hypothetical protein
MKDLIDKTPKIESIKLKAVISEEKGIIVSARTIRRVFFNADFPSRVVYSKPLFEQKKYFRQIYTF